MLTMDSVKGRMDSGGITFLEFNYMVMQAADFLHLRRSHNCTLQMGGQDQWGNIVMGIELTRRIDAASVAGLTMPLITKADGGKFGKSEKGNVWLSADRTPIYEFYQFWRNAADADVSNYLRYFTLLSMDEVRRLESLEGNKINEAKEALAFLITEMVHGNDAALQAQSDARKAFSSAADVTGDSIPHGPLAASELEEGIGILTLFVRAGLCQSNGDARRLVTGRGARIHGEVIEDPRASISTAHLQDGYLLLRAGKKKIYRFDIT